MGLITSVHVLLGYWMYFHVSEDVYQSKHSLHYRLVLTAILTCLRRGGWHWRPVLSSEEIERESEIMEWEWRRQRKQLKVIRRQSSISWVSVYLALDFTRDLVAYAAAPGSPVMPHLAGQKQGGRLRLCPKAPLRAWVIYLTPLSHSHTPTGACSLSNWPL